MTSTGGPLDKCNIKVTKTTHNWWPLLSFIGYLFVVGCRWKDEQSLFALIHEIATATRHATYTWSTIIKVSKIDRDQVIIIIIHCTLLWSRAVGLTVLCG